MPELVVCRPDDPEWLRVVRQSPGATAFHHPAWIAAVSETYGYPAFVLAWRAGSSRVIGGLPVVQVSNPIGRSRMVSLPFTDHCPPVFEDGRVHPEFVEAVQRWRAERGEASLEVRADLEAPDAHPTVVGTRHVLALDPDPEALFRRLHRNRIQKRIRRAREFGVSVTLGRSSNELATFYRLHCQTRRRQGVPVQPRRFIERIWRRVIEPGLGFVVTARLGELPVATALFMRWNRDLIYKYGASDRTRWNLGANFLVHWTAIEWACANGFRSYDLGRTDLGHDSLRRFKAGWGAEEIPLVYTRFGARTTRLAGGRAGGAGGHALPHSPPGGCRALGEVLYPHAPWG